ncbi:MAG: bifunctional UDP-N-acetylglucosamine diphosphorylase/glucosamine-1-phosphate N-acetyltransferase GlmU [Stagnimonas sp.]|nr:bifunctional UDP-N-acetylglucosamine diphosphorylase/glucosamine-1-phosphate N-acetyltransferase GlmU [Stagnimonas sp.]
MTPAALHCIVLAAGQGTRMKSALPKVLHRIGGKPMLGHVLDAVYGAGAQACHVVHGHAGEQVQAWVRQQGGDRRVHWAEQSQQLGTGHAVLQAMPQVPDEAVVLVAYGDVPLIRSETLAELAAAGGDGLAIATVQLADPRGYGRVLRDAAGQVRGIIEENDASEAERAIREANAGLLAAPARLLRPWLNGLGNDNRKGEYYLTDVVASAVREGRPVRTVPVANPEEVEGVNDRVQLARQERVYQRRQAETLMREGVGFADPSRFELRGTLTVGRDVFIDVGAVIEGDCSFADGVSIGPYCVLKDVRLGAHSQVLAHSVLEGLDAGQHCRIGPFARVRPGSRFADEVHIGNFVEVKKSELGGGTKAGHLAYLGDAMVGARVNISAGVITCNYDGVNKHTTVIGDDAFIGTDSQLVAPVTVERNAYIAAGSTITKTAPADALTICRAREQKSIAGWAKPKKR